MKLAISHNIFLSKEQRYRIATWTQMMEVSTVGVFVPVWYQPKMYKKRIRLDTSEPGNEIICNYVISNLRSDRIVEVLQDGYRIFLPNDVPQKLLDVQDRGTESVTFRHYSTIMLEGIEYKVGHYVAIRDESVLSKTLAF